MMVIFVSFNRTFMELKHWYGENKQMPMTALIGPSWN